MRALKLRAVGAAALLALPIAGCSASASGCLPAPLELSKSEVKPGLAITVTAAAVDCDLETSGRYELTVEAGGVEWTNATAQVADDGSFEARVPVPGSAEPGEARIVVRGSPYDDCPETNDGECEPYAATFTIVGE